MNNIVINFPTNVGDVILALPVLDKIRTNYPQSKITAIASPRSKGFLLRNTLIDEVVVFDKSWKATHKMRFSLDLRGKYNMIIDLKNSLLPVLLGVKIRTSFVRRFSDKVHIVDKYLKVVEKRAPASATLKSDFILEAAEQHKWDALGMDKGLFIACTSLSRIKQYPSEYVSEVVSRLDGEYPIVALGDKNDEDFYKGIGNRKEVIRLVGKTHMWEVFYLLKRYARLLLGVDSSITHMASYLDIPVVAIFGPTSFERSYPRSQGSVILRREELDCLPCEGSRCWRDNECMRIEPKKVVENIKRILTHG